MTGSIRNFEKLNFTPKSSAFCFSQGQTSKYDRLAHLPIRRGLIFANAEGYYFCQSGGVLFLPIRRGLVFANPEGSCFCQFGGVLILPIRRVTILLRLK